MPKVDALTATNPLILVLALFAGMSPALLWLFFWLREDTNRREPLGLIILTFIAGMLAVVFVLPFERFIGTLTDNNTLLTTLWAASEEFVKYFAFAAIVGKSVYLDEPIEYVIYAMTAALGFAALENGLFLVHPLASNDGVVSLLTGNLRFLGATLLHSVTTGIVGASVGLAYFKSRETKFFYWVLGMGAAITLHTVFNFFIIQKGGENFLQVFAFLWVVTIIIMLLCEKLRRMGRYVQHVQPAPLVQ